MSNILKFFSFNESPALEARVASISTQQHNRYQTFPRCLIFLLHPPTPIYSPREITTHSCSSNRYWWLPWFYLPLPTSFLDSRQIFWVQIALLSTFCVPQAYKTTHPNQVYYVSSETPLLKKYPSMSIIATLLVSQTRISSSPSALLFP